MTKVAPNNRLRPLVVSLSATAIALLATVGATLYSQDQSLKLLSLGATAVSATLAVAVGLLRYLGDASVGKSGMETDDTSGLLKDLNIRISNLEAGRAGITEGDRESLIARLQEEAAVGIIGEFEAGLRAKYGPAVEPKSRARRVTSLSSVTLGRLRREIRSLMRRANLNLVLGIITTCTAATLLAIAAFSLPHLETIQAQDWRVYAPFYLVRLSLVVFIEIFAFFFLRLYRETLADIKYFQNEMTNIEVKIIALNFAILSSDVGSAAKVAEELARTERNFILRKGESTVDIEKGKLEGGRVSDLIHAIKGLAPRSN